MASSLPPSTREFTARNADDLMRLRGMIGLDRVDVDAAALKHAGLMLHAVKFAYWAVRVGGKIVVHDEPDFKQGIEPWRIGFPVTRQITLSAIGRDCVAEPPDGSATVVLTRKSSPPGPGWSVGVIISGADEEFPVLAQCLDGLSAQPELMGDTGEILVCGPVRDLTFLSPWPHVRYVSFDAPPVKPFPIGRKKNHLVRAMRGPRQLVLHARIVLDPDVLRNAPDEFDFMAPNVMLEEHGRRAPNVCYSAIDASHPNLTPHRAALTTRHVPASRYLLMLRDRRPYIDGGALFSMKSAYSLCPLDESLGWGDMEDVEHSRRADALGLLCDLATEVSAVSQTGKVRASAHLPRPIHAGLQAGKRAVTTIRNHVRYRFR